jgi:hypothetical protein
VAVVVGVWVGWVLVTIAVGVGCLGDWAVGVWLFSASADGTVRNATRMLITMRNNRMGMIRFMRFPQNLKAELGYRERVVLGMDGDCLLSGVAVRHVQNLLGTRQNLGN